MKKLTDPILILVPILLLILLVAILAIIFPREKYDKEWIIGKTSLEIEARYGEFDLCENIRSPDGLYRNSNCGYMTKEGKAGFFGTPPDKFLSIYFDSNGIAYKIKENYPRPGG